MLGKFIEDGIGHGEASFALAAASFSFVFAAQEAAGERAPRAETDAEFLRGGNALALDISLGQRIFELQCGDALISPPFGEEFARG